MNDGKNFIFNADDAGISKGVNKAIEEMILDGKLNSFSIFVNQKYTKNAIEIAKKYDKKVKIGLHLNLTTGKSIIGHEKLQNLTNRDGTFKNGFIGLFYRVIFQRKKILEEISLETEAQINELKKSGLNISHINGHRHVHSIPFIFDLVFNLAIKNRIEKIRVINENLLTTIKQVKNLDFLFNGGIIKFLTLKTFTFFNVKKNNIKTDTYFFSILHSCRINKDMIKNLKIPRGFNSIEIMLHPGNPKIDAEDKSIYCEKEHLLSKHRKIETLE